MSSFARPGLPGPGRTHPKGQAFRTLWRSDPGLIVEVRKKVVRMRTHEHVHDPVAGLATQGARRGGGHDPDPPRGRGLTIAVVIATVTAMVLVAITGAAMIDQRNQIADRDAAIAAALVQRDRAQASVVALTQRIEVLQAQAATAATGKQALTRRLAAAQAQLQRMLGPALPDGKYHRRADRGRRRPGPASAGDRRRAVVHRRRGDPGGFRRRGYRPAATAAPRPHHIACDRDRSRISADARFVATGTPCTSHTLRSAWMSGSCG